MRKTKRVVVVRDGKTETYEGTDAAAYVAGHPELPIPPGDQSRMIVSLPNDPSTRIEVQDIPAVTAAKCGIGSGKPASMLVQNGNGPRRLIVVCTDHIQKISADAAAAAGNGRQMEHDAYAHALAGLLDARTSVAANTDMKDADRSRALTAIDQSIAEMKGQLARFD